ncbi:MAG: oligosaccharide flippase family protein [Methylococcaceae bacterium]|nr:oligosaccharide flippase family protein [Methylococcaceae bacterium]
MTDTSENISDSAFVLKQLTKAFAHHKRLFFQTFIVVLALGITYAYIKRPAYEATARLYVKLDQRGVTLSPSETHIQVASKLAEEAVATEAEMLGGMGLITETIEVLGPDVFKGKKPDNPIVAFLLDLATNAQEGIMSGISALGLLPKVSPKDKAIAIIKKDLTVFPVRRTQVIELAFKHKNAEATKKVLDTLIDVHAKKLTMMNDSAEDYEFYQHQTDKLSAELDTAVATLLNFKQKHHIVDIQAEITMLVQRIDNLTATLDGTSLPVAVPKITESVNNKGEGMTDTISPSNVEIPQSSNEILQLASRLNDLKIEYARRNTLYEKTHPLAKELEVQISGITSILQKQVNHLVSTINNYKGRLNLLTNIEPELNRLARTATASEEQYRAYALAAQERRLAKEQQSRIIVQVLDPPKLPETPVSMSRIVLITIALLAALVLSVAAIILMEWLEVRGIIRQRKRMAASEPFCSEADLAEHNANIKRVSANTVFLIFGQLVSKAVNFGYFLFLARVFTLSEFGSINYVLSVLLLAHTLAECGLTRLVIRDIGQDESRLPKYLATLIPLKMGLTFSAYLILCTIFWLRHSENLMPLLLIGGASLVPLGLGTLFNVFLQARQMMQYSSIGEILLSVSQVAFGVFGILYYSKPETVFLSYFCATVAYMLFLGLAVHRSTCRLSFALDFSFILKLLRSALPYAGIGILIALSLRVEILVLGWYCSSAEVGIYSVAAKFPEAAMFFPLMLASSVAPVLAKIHGEDSRKLQMTYLWGLQRLVQFLLPFSIAVILCAELIIDLLFTADYSDAAPILKILFLAFPFFSLQMLNSSILLTSTNAKQTLILYTCITLLQFISALACIQLWGVMGAALSFMASQTLGFLISYHYIKRWFLDEGGALYSIRLPVLAALAMSLGTYFVREISIFITVPVAVSVYFAILYGAIKASSSPEITAT